MILSFFYFILSCLLFFLCSEAFKSSSWLSLFVHPTEEGGGSVWETVRSGGGKRSYGKEPFPVLASFLGRFPTLLYVLANPAALWDPLFTEGVFRSWSWGNRGQRLRVGFSWSPQKLEKLNSWEGGDMVSKKAIKWTGAWELGIKTVRWIGWVALVTFNLSISFSLCQVEAVLELINLQGALKSPLRD